MNNSIFDLYESEKPKSSDKVANSIFDLYDNAPSPNNDDSYLDKMADYGKTATKGIIEGISNFGRMIGPLQEQYQGDQLTPEKQAERLDEMIPVDDEDYGQKSLRRGLGMAPSALSFPGSQLQSLPRSILAGFTGQAAEEMGLPEWAQAAAEITAFIGPDITKKLLSKGSNKEVIDAARGFGMTDEQIAPLLQSDFKQKWLAKLTPRRGTIQKRLADTKKGIQNAWSSISETPEASANLQQTEKINLTQKFHKELEKMPASVRNKIKEDMHDLYNKGPITGKRLMEFWTKINHEMGPNSLQLSQLKGPIKDAIKSMSPKMAKDFEMVNRLYTKYYDIAAKLKPNLMTDIVGASESIGLLFGMATGNAPLLTKVAGEKTLRLLSRELLTNPRFQQIGEKIVEAANANKPAIVIKLAKTLSRNISDIDPELSDKLYSLTEEEIKEFLSHQTETDEQESLE